jgi:hypothetical protein
MDMKRTEVDGSPNACKYGNNYYALRLDGMTAMIWADRVDVRDGCLLVYGHFRDGERVDDEKLLCAYPSGSWLGISATSWVDGHHIHIDSRIEYSETQPRKKKPIIRGSTREEAMRHDQ